MVLDTEMISKFASNLQKEFTDPYCVGYNMAWGAGAYYLVDNSGIDNIIERTADSHPLSSNQKALVANALTYTLVRVSQKAFEDTVQN